MSEFTGTRITLYATNKYSLPVLGIEQVIKGDVFNLLEHEFTSIEQWNEFIELIKIANSQKKYWRVDEDKDKDKETNA